MRRFRPNSRAIWVIEYPVGVQPGHGGVPFPRAHHQRTLVYPANGDRLTALDHLPPFARLCRGDGAR